MQQRSTLTHSFFCSHGTIRNVGKEKKACVVDFLLFYTNQKKRFHLSYNGTFQLNLFEFFRIYRVFFFGLLFPPFSKQTDGGSSLFFQGTYNLGLNGYGKTVIEFMIINRLRNLSEVLSWDSHETAALVPIWIFIITHTHTQIEDII